MSNPAPDLPMLARYTAWANRRLYDTIARLPPARLDAPTPVFAGSLLRTLHHVYLIDAVWQAHLLGTTHGYTTRNPDTAPPFDELRAAQANMDAWYIGCADALDAQARAEIVRFAFIGGGEGALSRGDILLHVANHTTYHRGHVTAMLYALGVPPPVTDLPVFLRERAQAGA